MKKLLAFTALALSAVAAFAAGNHLTLPYGNNLTWTVHLDTIKTMVNSKGVSYQTGLISVIESQPPSKVFRFRIAVTGCMAGTGEFTYLKSNGAYDSTYAPSEWVEGGGQVSDEVAVILCNPKTTIKMLKDPFPAKKPGMFDDIQ